MSHGSHHILGSSRIDRGLCEPADAAPERRGSWLNPAMYVIIWRYSVERAKEAEFRAAYGPDGDWARLFSSSPGFRGVELLALEAAGERVTIDRWATEGDFRAFMAEHGQRYAALDERLADLTVSEDLVARGEIVRGSPD